MWYGSRTKGVLAMTESREISAESFLDLLRSRRSIRRYLPESVPDEPPKGVEMMMFALGERE